MPLTLILVIHWVPLSGDSVGKRVLSLQIFRWQLKVGCILRNKWVLAIDIFDFDSLIFVPESYLAIAVAIEYILRIAYLLLFLGLRRVNESQRGLLFDDWRLHEELLLVVVYDIHYRIHCVLISSRGLSVLLDILLFLRLLFLHFLVLLKPICLLMLWA